MATIVSDLVSHLQCGESITANDAVYIDSATGKIFKFDPTDDTQTFAGLAKEAGVLNDFIRVSQSGRIKGFTGLTPGAFVYASVTVPGSFQLVEPAPSQKVILGIAKSATELIINGGLGIKPGGDGSGGGLDAYYVENMEGLNDTSDFAKGNNATFLGGGTFQGSLVIDDVAPISGLKSLKYTQAAGSLNDYFASEIIDIDLKQQDNDSGMTLYFEYDGNDNDMCFVVWDVTNNQRLSSEVAFVKLANKATRYSLSFYVPASCTQIRWGAQVLVVNSGKVLVVDDVEMSTDPFMEGEVFETQTELHTAGNITNGIISGPSLRTVGSGLFNYNSITGVYTILKQCHFTISATGSITSTSAAVISVAYNGSKYSRDTTDNSSSGRYASASFSIIAQPGDTFYGITEGGQTNTNSVSVSAMSATPHVLTPVDTFSTDTAPLTYAGSSQYNLSTLANAPVGTFITFTYAISTNTRTQTNAAPPTQSTSDMNVNGIQIFTRPYNTASTAASPAALAIQIGKGLKGYQAALYSGVSKSVSGSIGAVTPNASSEGGVQQLSYNEKTGILVVDAGLKLQGSANTAHNFYFSQPPTTQNNGYLTINASKSAALTAVPTPLVAYLKDVKPSGTAGGTFTAGSWQTRTLNTLEGDTSFVTLSANQFTLPAGRYEIEGVAPALRVNNHKIKLRNITDSSDTILGSTEYSVITTGGNASSSLTGSFMITSAKVFELQHRCSDTFASQGFGGPTTFGVSEVYAQVTIRKVS